MVGTFACNNGTPTIVSANLNPAYCDDGYQWDNTSMACIARTTPGTPCDATSATFGGFTWDIPALDDGSSTNQITSHPNTINNGSQTATGNFVCTDGTVFMESVNALA